MKYINDEIAKRGSWLKQTEDLLDSDSYKTPMKIYFINKNKDALYWNGDLFSEMQIYANSRILEQVCDDANHLRQYAEHCKKINRVSHLELVRKIYKGYSSFLVFNKALKDAKGWWKGSLTADRYYKTNTRKGNR